MASAMTRSSERKLLTFSIHKYSSFSSNYVPENICVDNPTDQASRWSSETNNPPQFLILKLDKPAIVDNITFGKYQKTHVCNLKKFLIYGGLSEEHLILLLEGGLKSDHIPEAFDLKHEVDGKQFPCRYIKIVPLEAWGLSFNFSIWYVELRGVDDASVVSPCMQWYNNYREKEVIRLCLKHFRQKNYMDAYKALQKRTKVNLEHPLLNQLHTQLVVKGDYPSCEAIIEQASDEGLFESYLNQQDYKPRWSALHFPEESSTEWPGMRGGHQMVIDSSTEMLYIFGGWDGNRDLADLWSFNISTNQWTCLSRDTEAEGGPSGRSCHKMCIDTERKHIFTLGRYIDCLTLTSDTNKADFYMYDIWSHHWTLITDDTEAMGGPGLIFDHQLAIDRHKQTMYVFGGRILVPRVDGARTPETMYSGLYSYYIPTNTWCLLRPDGPELWSRVGHTTLFHDVHKKLYIFGGQREKEYLNDFVTYDVNTGEICVLCSGQKTDFNLAPPTGFTQRSTIDCGLNEIHVFSGLSKDFDKRGHANNALWVYNIEKSNWLCVYRNDNPDQDYWSKMQKLEPVPRYAHQLVYDNVKKMHYLFGGNPGKDLIPKIRLDDLWSLKLFRPTSTSLLRRCQYLIRKAQFSEIAETNTIDALRFLQTDLASSVDHDNKDESKEFQLLASALFKKSPHEDSMINDNSSNSHFNGRTKLFDELVDYFPKTMTQPKANLIDLISL